MSARYIAAVWDEVGISRSHDLRAQLLLRYQGWTVALDRPGILVLVDVSSDVDSRIYCLDGGAGVVLGTLYEGASAPAPEAFNAALTTRVEASAGAYLLQRFWGSYVAFLFLERRVVLRDPSGCQQCYYSQLNGATFFFSRLTDFDHPIDVSWRYVRWRLAFGAIPCRQTGIQDVNQLMPGEAFLYCAGRSETRCYWNLQSIAADVVESEKAARELLYSATVISVHAWASQHPRILLLLSGGLDSAIVLACLLDAPGRPQVFALNNYSAGSDSDERKYARLAADQAGVGLTELERDASASWDPIFRLRCTPVPYATLGAWQTCEQTRRISELTGAHVYFSGGGGDVLFYRHGGAPAAADYLGSHANPRDLVRHLLSAAYRDHKSVWRVLAHALYYGPLRRRYPILPDPRVVRPLLGPEMRAASLIRDFELHPSIATPGNMPSGKQYQAACMVSATCCHESPLDPKQHLTEIAPLLSQPLMEAAMRVPLYVLTHDGRDRSLARDAFSGKIPQAIEQRQSKGGLEEYAKQSLLTNMTLVKELLVDGLLVSEGLLDREKLLEVLARRPSEIVSRIPELYDYVNIEAWLRSCSSTSSEIQVPRRPLAHLHAGCTGSR